MTIKRTTWQNELEALLSICEQRAHRANQLPHCAICARYSGTSHAFEAILSLIERLPAPDQRQAVAIATERLVRVPASQRSQQVTAANFGPLLDSPGWPLVGSLTIDMANEDTASHLSHAGLAGIEELTLLGFAYGNAVAGSNFTTTLLDSALTNVRVLTLHSADLADEDRSAFWSSPFAARLERIEGITYCGERLPHTLQAKEISLRGMWDAVESFDYLLQLISPETTPFLQTLNLGTYYAEAAAPVMFKLLEDYRQEFERVPELEIGIYGRHELAREKLRTTSWPKSLRQIAWSWGSNHGTILGIDGGLHTVYRPKSGDNVASQDAVTHLSSLVVELADVSDLPRSLRELKLIAPATATLDELLAAVGRFEHLSRLCLIYPFGEAQLRQFLGAVPHLAQIEIHLTMKTGCSSTQYRQEHEEGYHTDAMPLFLLETALAGRHLSIYSDSLDVSRTASGLEHVTAKTEQAILELAGLDPRELIEALTIETQVSAEAANALAKCTLLGRVYRLNIDRGFSNEAAGILAACPLLRTVRILHVGGYRDITEEGFATLIRSPHLVGVLDLGLMSTPEGCDTALADAPLLPSLVALDLSSGRDSETLPAAGRLVSLRRIGEGLSMEVLQDGRLARKWLNAGTAIPLRSRIQQFVDWVYRIPEEPLADLISRIENCESEDHVQERLRDVVACAFAGTPVPDGEPFVNLTPRQQTTLRAITKLDSYYWNVCGLMCPVLESYGLPRFERTHLERYIAGKDVWGHDEEQADEDTM